MCWSPPSAPPQLFPSGKIGVQSPQSLTFPKWGSNFGFFGCIDGTSPPRLRRRINPMRHLAIVGVLSFATLLILALPALAPPALAQQGAARQAQARAPTRILRAPASRCPWSLPAPAGRPARTARTKPTRKKTARRPTSIRANLTPTISPESGAALPTTWKSMALRWTQKTFRPSLPTARS